MRGSHNNLSGHGLELDLLYPDGDPRIAKIRHIHFVDVQHKQYHDAIRACIQGDNPNGYRVNSTETYDPPAGWARDIHYRLAEKLLLEDWSNVKIFPASGTSADIHHGIDFIVQFTEPKTGKQYLVTVDITMRDAELKHQKADVLVTRYGALANDKYPYVAGLEVPEMSHETREEEQENERKRRQAVADVIVGVLRQKILESNKRQEVEHKSPTMFRRHRHPRRLTDRGDRGTSAGPASREISRA